MAWGIGRDEIPRPRYRTGSEPRETTSEKERADASRFVEEFPTQSGWNPAIKAAIAGGLLYREYGFLKRWMMNKIARDAGKDTDISKNHAYTDWAAVDRIVSDFLVHLEQQEKA